MNETAPAGGTGGVDLSRIRSIDKVDVRGKRVLVRVDFNVPIEGGKVADPTRIARVLPTIAKLAREGAKVIVLSHLGRPKGTISPETSLKPVAEKMKELMGGTQVRFVGDCIGEEARNGLAGLRPGEVAVLQNVRFYPGEEKNDANFARRLAEHGDLYVDDAFSSAHRAHASIEAITKYLPSYAGLLMMAEITALGEALETPERPVMAIVGGSKVSTKIEVLTNLVSRMDRLVIGGAMANTFLLAKGVAVGTSFVEPDFVDTAKDIMARAQPAGCRGGMPGAGWQGLPLPAELGLVARCLLGEAETVELLRGADEDLPAGHRGGGERRVAQRVLSQHLELRAGPEHGREPVLAHRVDFPVRDHGRRAVGPDRDALRAVEHLAGLHVNGDDRPGGKRRRRGEETKSQRKDHLLHSHLLLFLQQESLHATAC